MQNLPDNLYNVASVVQLEQIAINQYGIPAYELMKRAGQAVFNVLQQDYTDCRKVLVLCGAGNNAGDGYVVARLAKQAGYEVVLVSLIDPASLKNEALQAYQDWLAVAENSMVDFSLIDQADVVVDALLGTGLSREVSPEWGKWISTVNNSGKPVISIDIPSGLLADAGIIAGNAIKADRTVSFIGLKQGMFTAQGKDVSGKVLFDDLQVPEEAYSQVDCNARLIRSVDYSLLPERRASSHKGNFGHVLIVGGNVGMPGAVILAARAALRCGAGLVTILTAEQNLGAVTSAVPEAMVKTCSPDEEAIFDPGNVITESLQNSITHIAIGMGLAVDDWALAMLKYCLKLNRPLLIDADALNLIATHQLADSGLFDGTSIVLTPHPGEAARLLSIDRELSTADIQNNRFDTIRRLHQLFNGCENCTAILKGSGSLIYDGSFIKVCNMGGPAMAAPGMGDVLSGIVSALMAQKIAQSSAAELGVCLHAAAAESVVGDKTRGLLASDLIDALPGVLQ